MDLLRLAHLTLPTATTFDSAHVAYYLFHDRMVFESIELLAPTMRLGGRGQMSLPQQQLNIALTTSNPRGLNLGPLTALIAKVRDQLITIRITGTLDRPVTRVQQLQGLSEAVADVLGEDDPKVSKSQVTRQP
jgi:hypothetical protein